MREKGPDWRRPARMENSRHPEESGLSTRLGDEEADVEKVWPLSVLWSPRENSFGVWEQFC